MRAKEINIGQLVSVFCKQRGYNLSEIARQIGISKQTLNGWLHKDDWSVKDLFTFSQVVGYDFVSMFTQPQKNDDEEQKTKVVLQIEVEQSKTNEVLEYIKDRKLYDILKN